MSALLWWAVSICSLAAMRKLFDLFSAIAFEIREAELDRYTTEILRFNSDARTGGYGRTAKRRNLLMRNVYSTLLMVISAAFPMLALAGTPSYSTFDQRYVITRLHHVENDAGVPTLPGSVEVADETFRYGPQRAANDRRGLGPRVPARGPQCRARVAELPDHRPFERGRPCIG
jgi:hypothetical protein